MKFLKNKKLKMKSFSIFFLLVNHFWTVLLRLHNKQYYYTHLAQKYQHD